MNSEFGVSPPESEPSFRLLVEAVQDYAIYMLDTAGCVVSWNSGAERNKGYSRQEILGAHFGCFFLPADRIAGLPNRLLREAEEKGRFAGQGWRVRKDGSIFWASVVISTMRDEAGKVTGYAKITRDLTEVKQQEEILRLSEAAFHEERDRLLVTLYSIADGVICTDREGNVTLMNPVAEFMTGWSANLAQGRPIDEIFRLVDHESGELIRNPVRVSFARNDVYFLDEKAQLIAQDGSRRDIQDSAAPIRGEKGEIVGAVLVFHDVTRLREAQREADFHATHDSLTLLPNRRQFEIRLEEMLHQTRGSGVESAVCFLDLDGFKVVNDTAGHEAGDVLLRTIGGLLKRSLRELDLVARLGGDEFVLILVGCTPIHAQGTLNEILEEIASHRFIWDKRVFRITASIGVTSLRVDSSAVSVMKQADVACYAAKRAGKNRVSIYVPEKSEAHDRHQELFIAADLREAIAQDRFSLFAQRIVPMGVESAPRYELLLRMNNANGELISPAHFIPAAERHGMMADLDRWMFERVLEFYSLRLSKIPDVRINLNLSANSLNDLKFLPYVLGLIEQSKLPASALTIEITETALISNLYTAKTVIEKLHGVGCRIALDDFGIGLSSFSYLRNFVVDFVKIEGSFVRNMLHSKVDYAVVKAINNIAHEIQAQTVAECVESQEILSLVKELGIDFAQGYALELPRPIEEIFLSH
jgi:diguanylate cyclase (GGDEF)-like protein/PAS domain S-box-containing protein